MKTKEVMRSVCEIGGKPPISALTNAFSIGLDRGQKTDDFEGPNHRNDSPRHAGVRLKGDAKGDGTCRQCAGPGDGQPTHARQAERQSAMGGPAEPTGRRLQGDGP